MPTFDDPRTDADEVAEAARGLAHATRDIAIPDDVYTVLGSLDYTLGSLCQSLAQLSAWHARHTDLAALDSGDREQGRAAALDAAHELDQAARLVAGAGQAVGRAHSANGRIAWQPDALERATRPFPGRGRTGTERASALPPTESFGRTTTPGGDGHGVSR